MFPSLLSAGGNDGVLKEIASLLCTDCLVSIEQGVPGQRTIVGMPCEDALILGESNDQTIADGQRALREHRGGIGRNQVFPGKLSRASPQRIQQGHGIPPEVFC